MTECAEFEQKSVCRMESISKQQADCIVDLEEDEKQKPKKISKVKSSLNSCTGSKTSNGSELERADGWVGEVLSGASDGLQPIPYTHWTHVIQIIVSCLKSSDTQHFYNLGNVAIIFMSLYVYVLSPLDSWFSL